MTTSTTSTLSNSVRVRQLEAYEKGAMRRRLYDQFAVPVDNNSDMFRSTSIVYEFLNNFDPAVDEISDINDVTPEGLTDATASFTTTSRVKVHRFSEKLSLTNFTKYESGAFEKIGDNMMESVDLLAQAKALQGELIYRGAARASLDAGTAGHRLTDATMSIAASRLEDMHCPQMEDDGSGATWIALMSGAPYYDLRVGGNIVSIATYQRPGIILNKELGRFGAFRIVASSWAKTFGAAGADNATNVATTLNGAVLKGAKTIVTAGDVSASIAAGRVWTIGTEETANTHYPDNELVVVTAASTTTLTIAGTGDNGGLRYNHDTGVAVRNADSVYPVVLGYPGSLVKAYSGEIGEYGQVSEIEKDGEADTFRKIWWKFYGGYGRIVETHMLRMEVASSWDA